MDSTQPKKHGRQMLSMSAQINPEDPGSYYGIIAQRDRLLTENAELKKRIESAMKGLHNYHDGRAFPDYWMVHIMSILNPEEP